jgi:hypothetical protein
MRNSDTNQQKDVFRAIDRFFQADGQWYFSASEGDIGPFRTREQARREAEAFSKAKSAAAGGGVGVREFEGGFPS